MYITNTAQSGKSYTHLWDVDTTREFEGGFLFDKTSVPTGTLTVPKGAFLKVDQTERKAKLIKSAVLHKALLTTDTEVQLEKGSLLLATDVIGTGAIGITVGTIDASHADYDAITITANALGALSLGAVLQSYDSAGASGKVPVNPDGLNYREIEIATDTEPSCSVIYEARGIQSANLPQKVTDAIKTALKFCQFIG